MVREWEVDWELQEEVRGINIAFQGEPDFGGFPILDQNQFSEIVCPVADTAIDSFGAWVELFGVTDRKSFWMCLQFSIAANPPTQDDADDYEVDLGVGAAGFETVILSEYPYRVIEPGPFAQYAPMQTSFPITIDAGVRVAVRLKSPLTALGRGVCFSSQIFG